MPGTEFSISYTTRAPREGEQDGIDYRFVDRSEFKTLCKRGDFVEWAEVFGELYGTHRADLERLIHSGRDIVLDIDIQGALQVRKALPQTVLVFILPPDFEALHKRLRGRGTEKTALIARRLSEARDEIEHAFDFDYLVVNESLEEAAACLRSIARAERQKRFRQEAILRQILNSFPVETENEKGPRAG